MSATSRVISVLKKRGWKASNYGITKGDDEEVRLVLHHEHHSGDVQLALLYVDFEHRGRGLAGEAMRDLTETADDCGAVLRLRAAPVGPKGLSENGLKRFYEKSGFVIAGDDMIRPVLGLTPSFREGLD